MRGQPHYLVYRCEALLQACLGDTACADRIQAGHELRGEKWILGVGQDKAGKKTRDERSKM